jgi:hypothetical protein
MWGIAQNINAHFFRLWPMAKRRGHGKIMVAFMALGCYRKVKRRRFTNKGRNWDADTVMVDAR